DVGGTLAHPVTHVVEAVSVDYDRTQWTTIGDTLKSDLAFLRLNLGDGDIDVITRSQDDKAWLVSVMQSDKPLHYFLYDRARKKVKLLFSHRPWLEHRKLAPMYARVIPSSD